MDCLLFVGRSLRGADRILMEKFSPGEIFGWIFFWERMLGNTLGGFFTGFFCWRFGKNVGKTYDLLVYFCCLFVFFLLRIRFRRFHGIHHHVCFTTFIWDWIYLDLFPSASERQI